MQLGLRALGSYILERNRESYGFLISLVSRNMQGNCKKRSLLLQMFSGTSATVSPLTKTPFFFCCHPFLVILGVHWSIEQQWCPLSSFSSAIPQCSPIPSDLFLHAFFLSSPLKLISFGIQLSFFFDTHLILPFFLSLLLDKLFPSSFSNT